MTISAAVIACLVNNHALAQSNDYECLIQPASIIKLSSPISGVISRITVDRGDAIKKGQTLVRLESKTEAAAVELAQAKYEFSSREVDRVNELFKEDFTSEHAVDEAKTSAKLAEVELKQAKAVLDQKRLRSPISGIVVKKHSSEGESVSTDEILTLARVDPLYVEVVLPIALLDTVTEGAEAKIFPQQPLGGEYLAIVKTVDNIIDAASGTFGVRLELANPQNAIPAGLRCRVEF